jgi:hypothetical protein
VRDRSTAEKPEKAHKSVLPLAKLRISGNSSC